MSRGLCECGCGQKTTIPKETNRSVGYVKRVPMRFVRGHNVGVGRENAYEVRDCGHDSPCWVWTRSLNREDGYGQVSIAGVKQNAHRWMYEQMVGPVRADASLDHKCENPPCVNPAHMEPVTAAENTRRGRSAKLTYGDVDAIRRLLAEGDTQSAVAGRFGVCQQQISHIARGRRWVAAGGVVV